MSFKLPRPITSARALSLRKRGALLMEAALSLSVLFAFFLVSVDVLREEDQKRKTITIASEHEVILDASRTFVENRYFTILQDLFADAVAVSGPAMRAYTIAELQTEGYLPATFGADGAIGRLYNQDYALIVRVVDAADTALPQATMTDTDLDPLGTGSISNVFVNNDTFDGEAELEAFLVSYGGTAMTRGMGGNIISRIALPYSGFVATTGTARGGYGNFSVDMSQFAALPEYPTDGHMASIVSLSNYGIVGAADGDPTIRDALRRCTELDISSPEYASCLSSNEMYNNVVLRPYDSDGDTIIDVYPAIRNVTMLDCAEGGATGTASAFTIDCPQVNVTGNIDVAGTDNVIGNFETDATSLYFDGDQILTRLNTPDGMENRITADRYLLDNGIDLSEGILDAGYRNPGQTVPKPSCPTVAADGVTPVQPRIYVQPASYTDEWGRPIVGVRTWGEDSGSDWTIQMLLYINQDACVSSASSPIPYGTNLDADEIPVHASCSSGGGEGDADVWTADPSQAITTYFVRCY